jgi:hypothetical protein
VLRPSSGYRVVCRSGTDKGLVGIIPDHLLDDVYDVNLQGEGCVPPGDRDLVPTEVVQAQTLGGCDLCLPCTHVDMDLG